MIPTKLCHSSVDGANTDPPTRIKSSGQDSYESSTEGTTGAQSEYSPDGGKPVDQIAQKLVQRDGLPGPSFNDNSPFPIIKSTVSWKPPFEKDNTDLDPTKTEPWSQSPSDESTQSSPVQKRKTFHLRGYDDDGDTDWWFASTAIPLLAATIAPLANVLSIAALVTYWRTDLRDPENPGQLLTEFNGILYEDPRWCYWLNVVTLICGFVGNIFLLANFTGRVRYIIALPCTIVFFFVSTSVLIAITIAMNTYVPPERPYETYSQGFWYAVIAAILYLICSFLLMINMLGYFLGHYPQRFELSDHQRTLIVQTMLFFIWLAGGGYMFSAIESRGTEHKDWAFVDGLYFCDVTILTVGFGDLTLRNDLGRALVFPYTVGAIVILGLVISSISKFAAEMSQDNVVRKHFERVRTRTLERTITNPLEADRKAVLQTSKRRTAVPSAPTNARLMHHSVIETVRGGPNFSERRLSSVGSERRASIIAPVRRRTNLREAVKMRQKKVRLLRHERDRFDEMRRIQQSTQKFKRYWALSLSVCAFAVLWLMGAVVFWLAEREVQGMSYFQALYFAYISLLTIGYGDFAPQSNAGRPFFVVWSLIAVPTITLLINDMGSTVIDSFKKGTFIAADWTVLLRRGIWSDFLKKHPKLDKYLANRKENKERKKRMEQGLGVPAGDDDAIVIKESNTDLKPSQGQQSWTGAGGQSGDRELNHLARELTKDTYKAPTESELAHHLSDAIRSVTKDLADAERKYTFEEWAELTRLIRFSCKTTEAAQQEEEEDPIDWDWLGEQSPMMANMSEPEFVMEKLCQSLARNMKNMERKIEAGKKEIERLKRPLHHVETNGKARRMSRQSDSEHKSDVA